MPAPAIPRATYRLQLNIGFTFADATAIVPYLAQLGISHLYLSPFLKARPGSSHGYDIVDHNAWNPEIGDEALFEALAAAARTHGMGLVMDVVPNHMAVGGGDNAWWLDVLEWGEDSPYARFFDIDWQSARPELKGRLLLPFLGEHYGRVLERGELVPRFDPATGGIDVWYWQHRFPIALRDYAAILAPVVARLGPNPDGDALADVVLDLNALAARGASRSPATRRSQGLAIKARLAELAGQRPAVAVALTDGVAMLAGQAGEPESFIALHRLMDRQAWRVSSWRVASDEINYRRFFDVNELAGLRMVEEPDLFDVAHRLSLDLVRRGLIQGIRIDHVDGLFNPAEYCRLLQERVEQMVGRPAWMVEIGRASCRERVLRLV